MLSGGSISLEEPFRIWRIAHLHLYFNPSETPDEFLAWLAQWASLSFRSELSVKKRRRLLAAILPLYQIRGTRKKYLEEILRIWPGRGSVSDVVNGLRWRIGVNSTIDSTPVSRRAASISSACGWWPQY